MRRPTCQETQFVGQPTSPPSITKIATTSSELASQHRSSCIPSQLCQEVEPVITKMIASYKSRWDEERQALREPIFAFCINKALAAPLYMPLVRTIASTDLQRHRIKVATPDTHAHDTWVQRFARDPTTPTSPSTLSLTPPFSSPAYPSKNTSRHASGSS